MTEETAIETKIVEHMKEKYADCDIILSKKAKRQLKRMEKDRKNWYKALSKELKDDKTVHTPIEAIQFYFSEHEDILEDIIKDCAYCQFSLYQILFWIEDMIRTGTMPKDYDTTRKAYNKLAQEDRIKAGF